MLTGDNRIIIIMLLWKKLTWTKTTPENVFILFNICYLIQLRLGNIRNDIVLKERGVFCGSSVRLKLQTLIEICTSAFRRSSARGLIPLSYPSVKYKAAAGS